VLLVCNSRRLSGAAPTPGGTSGVSHSRATANVGSHCTLTPGGGQHCSCSGPTCPPTPLLPTHPHSPLPRPHPAPKNTGHPDCMHNVVAVYAAPPPQRAVAGRAAAGAPPRMLSRGVWGAAPSGSPCCMQLRAPSTRDCHPHMRSSQCCSPSCKHARWRPQLQPATWCSRGAAQPSPAQPTNASTHTPWACTTGSCSTPHLTNPTRRTAAAPAAVGALHTHLWRWPCAGQHAVGPGDSAEGPPQQLDGALPPPGARSLWVLHAHARECERGRARPACCVGLQGQGVASARGGPDPDPAPTSATAECSPLQSPGTLGARPPSHSRPPSCP